MKRPHSLSIDEIKGYIYVADVEGKRVAIYNENLEFIKAWPTPDVYVLSTEKFENAPHGIVVDQ